MIGIRRRELQQLSQGHCTGLVHGGPDRRFDALQIEFSGRVAITENDPKQFLYLAGDFELDDLRRFFSWSVRPLCSTGRKRQILRLTSTRSFDSP